MQFWIVTVVAVVDVAWADAVAVAVVVAAAVAAFVAVAAATVTAMKPWHLYLSTVWRSCDRVTNYLDCDVDDGLYFVQVRGGNCHDLCVRAAAHHCCLCAVDADDGSYDAVERP